ncbi:STAS domain-containing protein [Kineococcus sp. GCM10028916]|uniref:STAS domain-containing protein n=1 Tax=Kineococcus sp. GCM10028916 TaxID=3273394 RepID=UPI003637EE4D
MTHTPLRIHLVTRSGTGPLRGAELPGATRTWTPVETSAESRAAVAVSGVSTRTDGDRFTVTLTGDVDLVLAEELARIARRVEQHCAHLATTRARVHLDVREVTAVDASALRFVERVRRLCAAWGAECTTSTARPAVEQVLALARPVVDGELAAS